MRAIASRQAACEGGGASADSEDLEAQAECGRAFMGEFCYTDDGRLMETNPMGICECNPNVCTDAACRKNAVVSRGITMPLEVRIGGMPSVYCCPLVA